MNSARTSSFSVAVLGSGPAALMAADVISEAGIHVCIFEKRKSVGRKLLVAGSSGLNITNHLPLPEFLQYYSGPENLWKRVISEFTPVDWVQFINHLGIATFEGTSGRFFVQDMKASRFLQAWKARLENRNVEFRFGQECTEFEVRDGGVELSFASNESARFKAVCFALGGASWEPDETPLRWPQMFQRKKLGFTPFRASNVGYQVAWSEKFLAEVEGKPLKNVMLTSSRGSRRGEAMITNYGIEGTPVYFVGETGQILIDLMPDLSFKHILNKLENTKENLSPIRRVKRQLSLSPAALALVFHQTPSEILQNTNLEQLARTLKAFPLELGQAQPLTEAISSAGGLHFEELDESFMLKRFPGVFAAGEMLDWDVPTGGFLIQGCVSQGRYAGLKILKYLFNQNIKASIQ